MPYKDLHQEPFDDNTITKLEIFEDYAQAWIPTFVMQGKPVICIFDFFAGTGFDIKGIAGSPIRILRKIKEQIENIKQKNVRLKVYFNEFEPAKRDQEKFDMLTSNCNEYLNDNFDVKQVTEVHFFNQNTEELFPKLMPEIERYPSLVYLDQNGIKFLSDKYLLPLVKSKQTDFLYFVSSGYFKRFGNEAEFSEHFKIDMTEAKSNPYKFIHRVIIQQLSKKLPPSSSVKLYPFSIKKGPNIHGIVFGASNPRAMDKFLTIAWKKNETNGEANFDIDDDEKKTQLNFFESKKLTKIEKFKETLRKKILSGEIVNNFDAYAFVLNEGHVGSHAADCIKEMKRERELNYNGVSPLVTYENVYKLGKKVEYIIVKK